MTCASLGGDDSRRLCGGFGLCGCRRLLFDPASGGREQGELLDNRRGLLGGPKVGEDAVELLKL
jgi:hypothetical protein